MLLVSFLGTLSFLLGLFRGNRVKRVVSGSQRVAKGASPTAEGVSGLAGVAGGGSAAEDDDDDDDDDDPGGGPAQGQAGGEAGGFFFAAAPGGAAARPKSAPFGPLSMLSEGSEQSRKSPISRESCS